MAEAISIRLKFLDLNTCDRIITRKNDFSDVWEFIAQEGDELSYMYCLWNIADRINAGKFNTAASWMKLIYSIPMGKVEVYSDVREVFYKAKMEMRKIIIDHVRDADKMFPFNTTEENMWGGK